MTFSYNLTRALTYIDQYHILHWNVNLSLTATHSFIHTVNLYLLNNYRTYIYVRCGYTVVNKTNTKNGVWQSMESIEEDSKSNKQINTVIYVYIHAMRVGPTLDQILLN